MSPFMVAPGSSVQSVSSRSGAVPPSARRLALPVDSEDYALEFLLDMPVIGIRTHAQAYAGILVSLGYGSLLTLDGLNEEEILTKQTVDAGVQIPQGYAKTIVQQAKHLHSVRTRYVQLSCTRYSFPNSLVEVVLGQSLQIRNRFAELGQPSVLNWRLLLAGRRRRCT